MNCRIAHWTSLILLFFSSPASGVKVPPPEDALTAIVHTEDVDRFAMLFANSQGSPAADQIQRDYLDPGSYGVRVFTPFRIRNAEHMAKAVASTPQDYRRAIDTCLPHAKASQGDLRSIYLALKGLLPEKPLPRIYIVFGAGNSGGTADAHAQVIGLEVVCRNSPTPDALRAKLRSFYAHETVHTMQIRADAAHKSTPLLANILQEGAADFISALVTGQEPNPERATWASERERDLWDQFEADLIATYGFDFGNAPASDPRRKFMTRWIQNYSHPPEGWPPELGYWIGARIWSAYFDAAADKRQAIEDMLSWTDAEDILRASGYREKMAQR